MSVLVVQHLVTLDQATRIMRLFKQKKHAGMGYYFDLQDLGCSMLAATGSDLPEPYSVPKSPVAWRQDAYLLRVYRDVPGR